MKNRQSRQVPLFLAETPTDAPAWPAEVTREIVAALADLLLAKARDSEGAVREEEDGDDPEDHR